MEVEEDSRVVVWDERKGQGEVPCRRHVLILPTDSRLLSCLPRKPNSSFCGLSRGPYMDALLP